MKSLLYIIVLLFLSDRLLASTIKLMKANEAIRLIGKSNVVFVSSDSSKEYEEEHIINALNIKMNSEVFTKKLSCPPLYCCPETISKYLQKRGIGADQTLIIYDRNLDGNATGIYSFFETFGHENIFILDGGLNAIKALDPNQKLFNTLNEEYVSLKNRKEKNFNSDIKGLLAKMRIIGPNLLVRGGTEKVLRESNLKLDNSKINLEYIADNFDMQRAVEDIQKDANRSQYIIIDARSREEFQGRKKLEGIARSGHILGAIHVSSKRITDFINKKTFKTLENMQIIFDRADIKKDKIIYTYSNYAIGRGAHIAAALRLLGYKNVKIFTGGWSSWGNDKTLPIVREDTI